ncbi:IS5 family transposase [Streptomyces chartreusis]|uniref:IS5 family transposase n=1 Tax=Streptomyces chartreusis TaxID=1969 RepID=UPI003866B6AE
MPVAPVLVLSPALTCGISVPASTLRRDCLPRSRFSARASNQRSANAFDPGDTTFSIILDEGAKSCRNRRPGASSRGHEEGNGGEHTGPSPVDRGKPGSKMHVLSDANGLPLVVGVSAANVHDSEGLKPMVAGIQTQHDPHRGRHFKPKRLHADKAYDIPHLRKWLWGKHIGVRIARKGIESSERLGRRRWVIERTISWLSGYRRLSPRYERHPRNYLAFLGLAAALCCYKRLRKLTM